MTFFFPCLCCQIPSVIKLIQYKECPFLLLGRCVHCNWTFWSQLKWGNAFKENSWRNRLSAEYRLGTQPYGMNFLFRFILMISSVIIKILSGSHDFWLRLHLFDLYSSSRYSNLMNSSILRGVGERWEATSLNGSLQAVVVCVAELGWTVPEKMLYR